MDVLSGNRTQNGDGDRSDGSNVIERPAEGQPGPARIPVSPRRPRNTVWMLGGLVLILISGLAAATIASSLSNRIDVLTATRPIAKGEVIGESDLRTDSISVGLGVRVMDPSAMDDLVGRVATGPIGDGSIVHPAQFTDGNAADQAKVIIGAALEPGEYPRVGLVPGDKVRIIEVSGPNAVFDESAGTGPREMTEGEIVEIARLARSDALLVSIRVNEAAATTVSERAEQSRIRLALVDNGFPQDLVQPLDPAVPAEPAEPNDSLSGDDSGS